jgi:hypothetical protein
MSMSGGTPSVRPSAGYLATLALGCAGLTFLGIGLGGGLIARAGGDSFDALNNDGIVMFLLGFAILFASRLIFWPPAPPVIRQTVRSAIAMIFLLGIIACAISLALAWHLPPWIKHSSMPLYFSVLAAPCQIPAFLWLARYRHEGL